MSFTTVNEVNIQNEIDKILNNIQCTPNLDDISKIRILENVLNFMYHNRKNLKKNLMIEAKKDLCVGLTDLFEKILKNETVQNFIFEHGASDDLSDAKTYDDLKNIYTYSLKFIEMMDRDDRDMKKYSNMNSTSSYATGSNFCAHYNAISLGSNSSASNRIMSRCNDYGGIKSVDYPFNPF